MSNSEEVSYSMDFENDDSAKSSRSQSYSSIAEGSKMKSNTGDGQKNNSGRSGQSAAADDKIVTGSRYDDTSPIDEASDKIVPMSGSSRSNRSDSVHDDDISPMFENLLNPYPSCPNFDFNQPINFEDYLIQSTHLSPQKKVTAASWNSKVTNSWDTKSISRSNQQFSNAADRYESSFLRSDNAGTKSSTDVSEISEIMRQLDDMERARGPLQSYMDQDVLTHSSFQPRGAAATSTLKTLEELQESITSTLKSSDMSSETSEIDEIDEIIKKLESLEKAQSALENALSKSEGEVTFQQPSSFKESLKPTSSSRLVALNSLQQQNQPMPMPRGAPLKTPLSPTPAPPLPPPQRSMKQQIDVDTADEMSMISEINSSKNHDQDVHERTSEQTSDHLAGKEQDSSLKRNDEVRQKQSSDPSLVRQDSSRSERGSKRSRKASVDSQHSARFSSSQVPQVENSEEKLKNEVVRQDALISAYQKEIEHLSKQLSTGKAKLESKEKEHADEINQLKTEVATMKFTHLMPVLPSSPRLGQKGEMERMRQDLDVKSNQVMHLHQEIARLKLEMKNSQAAVESAKQKSTSIMSDDKEKEYQNSIRALEKQVRTLQKMTFHKDPAAIPTQTQQSPAPVRRFGSKADLNGRNVSSTGTQTQRTAADDEMANNQQCTILEQRITELEKELAKADSEAKEKVEEFQGRLKSLTGKYEARIKDLEYKLSDAEDKISSTDTLAMQDMTTKLDKAYGEIASLKLEVGRSKREIDILSKTSKATQNSSKNDANTLSLALKSFKLELAEKEKELVRYKKEIAELKKTNTSLKRERERYLHGTTNPPVPTYTRTKSDLSESPKKNRGNLPPKSATSFEDLENAKVRGSKLPQHTLEFLQSTLEEERREFENIMKEKNNSLDAKEKEIKELEQKLDKIDIPVNRRDSLEEKNLMLEELRTRIQAQNRVIEGLKNHMSSYTAIESELRTLRQGKGLLEFRIRELSQKLVLAKTLNKPENEILGELMEKVESLNSRYFYREKQIDVLLNRLSTSSFTSSSRIPDMDTLLYPRSPRIDMEDRTSPPIDIHLADI